MSKNSEKFMILFAVAVLVTLTVGIVSAVPVTQNITYQGKLTDAAGNLLTGTYSVTFRLYGVSTGGAALATDTHTVQASKGLFTTQITSDTSFFDGRALWLGITVGADAEMTPRQEIRPVPYALGLRPWVVGASFTTNQGGTSWDDLRSGINVSTGNAFNPGLNARTTGYSSNGMRVLTTGDYSHGVDTKTSGVGSEGVHAYTSGKDSDGVHALTDGQNSNGVLAYTYGYGSTGVNVSTSGTYSNAVRAHTNGDSSRGVNVSTSGIYSTGVYAITSGSNSDGVSAITSAQYSHGVVAQTSGWNSFPVAAYTNGEISYGVFAESEGYTAIWARTGRSDNKYGVQTPDYIRALGYETGSSDVAEYMPVSGDVAPGTVLIIRSDGKLEPSSIAYDTGVAGIVSTAPGVFLGAKENGNPGEQPIAVAGRVPCKVDASNGPIHPRDLLTTSDNPGYAMKATDPKIGTILGKAMGSLESGTGTIEILVTLQ